MPLQMLLRPSKHFLKHQVAAGGYSEYSKTSKMELFAKIVGSENASELCEKKF